MQRLLFIFSFTCACIVSQAQVNFVLNPSLEDFWHCPKSWNQIDSCKFWGNAIDSSFFLGAEYYNSCAGNNVAGVPNNISFYQPARSGKGMAGANFYYDGTSPIPPSPLPENFGEYLQGRLMRNLKAGKSYCVTFYVSLTEASGYANNKIGAYLDDGSFDDTVSLPGSIMTFVTPQVYTDSIVDDTANWVKVEGSFVADGIERYITIGNFFTKAATKTKVTDYWSKYTQYSYYLIDDVSVIETDLQADAGIDKGIHLGDSTFIGRGLDSAFGLDCKWYHKGVLIDSAAGIWVKSTAKGIDTYAVVQTICGNVKTDTVLVYTFDVGVDELPGLYHQVYELFPNPSDGVFTIRQMEEDIMPVRIIVYNSLGSVIYSDQVVFSEKKHAMELSNLPAGMYAMQVTDNRGRSQSMRFTLQD